jgi:hypothetical protein
LRRVPNSKRAYAVDETPFEFIGDRLDDNEALGGDAALARILIAGADARVRSRMQVGVSQDDEGVRASKLQNALLEGTAARAADFTAGGIASSQCYRPNTVILNQRLGRGA